ncbi:MAG: DNA translocase FtsK [Candidatus Omnitrophica bacterium]|nr:DNA translocase FtsK [Candidatus Omnitrophota bacterium]
MSAKKNTGFDIFAGQDQKKNEVIAILLFAVALFLFMSLLTFDYGDIPSFSSTINNPTKNFAGIIGAYIACSLKIVMGTSSYVFPVLLVFWAVMRLGGGKPENIFFNIIGVIFFVSALSATFSLFGKDTVGKFNAGGMIGAFFSDFLLKYLGNVGTAISIFVLLLLSILVATDFLIFPFFRFCIANIKTFILFLKSMSSKAKEITRHPKINYTAKERFVSTTSSNRSNVDKEESSDKNNKSKEKIIIKQKVTAPSVETNIKPIKKKVKEMDYELPSLGLLNDPEVDPNRMTNDDIKENSEMLETILSDFGITAKVIEVSIGPVITRYELEPAAGVKVHRITSLSDNIALGMKAQAVRILAPVPGKGTIGVEIPNKSAVMVYFKEILESKEFNSKKGPLKIALGKDVAGEPVIADLAQMPHLLIAGATGSGKTVCVNTIIASLLFTLTPEEVRFIMIDPKKVELVPYNNIPHLLYPVITDYKKVPLALEWCVGEMERRYTLFADSGVRNIDGYNKEAEKQGWQQVYYIVVVIDELADLMMVAQKEIEGTIQRLAQLARAVGIHMILATQRPSVNVITGTIKANFPARLSFKVASKTDSRTVLDQNGADALLGKGDMLFIEPGTDKPLRAQGGLVLDDEIDRLTEFIKKQREPEFVEDIAADSKRSTQATGQFKRDEEYQEAVELVVTRQQASTSMLQRKLGIGYAKAGRLIDMMEDDGIVGAHRGSKPREVLIEDISELEKQAEDPDHEKEQKRVNDILEDDQQDEQEDEEDKSDDDDENDENDK